jgi:hypothetical protein
MGYFVLVAMLGGFPPGQPPRPPVKIVPPRTVVKVRPKIALKPGQACAIPLLNVLPKEWRGDDKMVKRIAPPPYPSGDVVAPPAPSCDDVK